MVACRREHKHRIDASNKFPIGCRGCVRGNCRAFLLALADDRLERVDACLDLEQDGFGAAIQAEIGRPTTGPRDGRLDACMPARVSHLDQRLDDPSMRRIMDERRRVGVDAEPEVGARTAAARARIRSDTVGSPASMRQIDARSTPMARATAA